MHEGQDSHTYVDDGNDEPASSHCELVRRVLENAEAVREVDRQQNGASKTSRMQERAHLTPIVAITSATARKTESCARGGRCKVV